MGFIPDSTSILFELLLTCLSIFSVALGLFFYVPANIIPVSVDGVTQALAIAFNKPFSKTKVVYDVGLLVISLILCFVFFGSNWGQYWYWNNSFQLFLLELY